MTQFAAWSKSVKARLRRHFVADEEEDGQCGGGGGGGGDAMEGFEVPDTMEDTEKSIIKASGEFDAFGRSIDSRDNKSHIRDSGIEWTQLHLQLG